MQLKDMDVSHTKWSYGRVLKDSIWTAKGQCCIVSFPSVQETCHLQWRSSILSVFTYCVCCDSCSLSKLPTLHWHPFPSVCRLIKIIQVISISCEYILIFFQSLREMTQGRWQMSYTKVMVCNTNERWTRIYSCVNGHRRMSARIQRNIPSALI